MDAIFDASLFPGLRLQLQSPSVKILVFSKGRVVLTGVNNRQNLQRAWATAKELVKPFLTDQDITHQSFQVAKNSRKKLKIADEAEEELFDVAQFAEA